jgi:hypothetical protein
MSIIKNLAVPYHGAQASLMDGAASAQMILEQIGALLNQNTIHTTIQSSNVEPTLWSADPEGMKGALNFHKPATFNNYFVMYARPTALQGSEKITYTLHHYQVATATLVFWGGVWLVVKGVQTDVDPQAGNPYTIEAFWIHNPWNPAGAANGEYVAYNPTWLNTYFTGVLVQDPSINQVSQWNGQYISVCDPDLPDLPRQVLRPPELHADGEELIDRQEIIRLAEAHFKKHELATDESFAKAWDGSQIGEPQLVHNLDFPNSYDYLVPLSRQADVTALLRLDGRYGFLQNAISFPADFHFPRFTWDEVRKLLTGGVLEVTDWIFEDGCIGQCTADRYRIYKDIFCLYPAMVWRPCWESRSPFFPFYLVTLGGRRFYISSWDGTVYSRLHPFGPSGMGRPGGI